MAFTEKYVTVAGAGAHDGTSEANAWTFAEMITAAPAAGSRVNIKAGSYSTGAVTFLAGTVAAPLVYRGYNSSIGDLNTQGKNADGTLNVTNFPVITVSAAVVPAVFTVFQNLSFTGAISAGLMASTTVDDYSIISCKFVNTQNNSLAQAFVGDDRVMLINSDFSCTGAAHFIVADIDVSAYVSGCYFTGTDTDGLLGVNNGIVKSSVFYGTGSNVGVVMQSSGVLYIDGNTFYNLDTAITTPNALNTAQFLFINNICTDCSKWINNLYSGTAAVGIIEYYNRTRDVTTLLTGTESVAAGAVTTDGGGAETDYVNAGSGNLRLIASSPATSAGTPAYSDIGAFQRVAASAQKSFSC